MTGTFDHFYDAADQLNELDTPFMVLVQPNHGKDVLVLGNVETRQTAESFLRAFREAVELRFGDDQSQPSS